MGDGGEELKSDGAGDRAGFWAESVAGDAKTKARRANEVRAEQESKLGRDTIARIPDCRDIECIYLIVRQMNTKLKTDQSPV